VLRDLAHQRLAVGRRHPVLGFDLDAGIDALLECALLRIHVLQAADGGGAGFDELCVHGGVSDRVHGKTRTTARRTSILVIQTDSYNRIVCITLELRLRARVQPLDGPLPPMPQAVRWRRSAGTRTPP